MNAQARPDRVCQILIAGRTTEKDAAKHEACWIEILGLLESELETGDIPRKTKVMYWMQGLFMWAMPKSTKAENWLPKE